MLEPERFDTLSELPARVQTQLRGAPAVVFPTDDLPGRGEVADIFYFPESTTEEPKAVALKVMGWHRNLSGAVIALLGRTHKDVLEVVYGDDWSILKSDFFAAQLVLINRRMDELADRFSAALLSEEQAKREEAARPPVPFVLCAAHGTGKVNALDRETLDMRGPDLLPGHRFRWAPPNDIPAALLEQAVALVVLPERTKDERYRLSPKQVELVGLFDDNARMVWSWAEQRAEVLSSAPEDGYIERS